jgi:hypothetical protein
VTAVSTATYNVRMLKIFVISLFVANLLLAGFQVSKPAPAQSRAKSQPKAHNSDVPTIHLFSELMENRDLMSGNRQCYSLGPFHESDEMYSVFARLQTVSVSIQKRETQALIEKGYWVFMPPYASLLEANEKLLSLQALGLKDIAIIFEGEYENSISLGYFLRQENALKRKKGLESRGYSPVIRVQRQAEPRYWLDYEQDPGSGLVNLDMQNRPNDFMQRATPCAARPGFEAKEIEFATQTIDEEPVQTSAALQAEESQSENDSN